MILLIGASGFIGTELTRELTKNGKEVKLLVRNPSHARHLKGTVKTFSQGDILDKNTILDAITEDVDTVVNLVGILSESKWQKGVTFKEAHVSGTKNVIEACKEKNITRYIHMSALGAGKDSTSNYYKTKFEAQEMASDSGLNYTIFKPSVVFGANDNFTKLFAKVLKLSPFVVLPGMGQNKMQPLFVKDLVQVMAASIDNEKCFDKTYEIGGKETLTFNETIKTIGKAMNESNLFFNVPLGLLKIPAFFAEFLPNAPITRDQLKMLAIDNVTDNKDVTEDFDFEPIGYLEGLKTYLS